MAHAFPTSIGRPVLRAVLAWLIALSAWLPGTARADDLADAIALVQRVRVAAITLARTGSEAERGVIEAAFDGNQIGRVVLGTHWTGASAADRAGVVAAMLDAIADGLADRLANTREQDFTVLGTQRLSNGDILVRSRFERPVRQPTAVDWRLRRCQGQLCVGDVIVDGASVTLQRRDQVAAAMAGNGGSIPQLITDLRAGRL